MQKNMKKLSALLVLSVMTTHCGVQNESPHQARERLIQENIASVESQLDQESQRKVIRCEAESFLLNQRGSILFISTASDGLVSVIDTSVRRKEMLMNYISALFNLDGSAVDRSKDIIYWPGFNGLDGHFDNASPYTGNKLGKTIFQQTQPLFTWMNERVQADGTLLGQRTSNEMMRRTMNMIPVIGYFLNKLLAAIDQGDQFAVGKSLYQLDRVISENLEAMLFIQEVKSEEARMARKAFVMAIRAMVETSGGGLSFGRDMARPVNVNDPNYRDSAEMEKAFKGEIEKMKGDILSGKSRPILRWAVRDSITLLGNILAITAKAPIIAFFLDGHSMNPDIQADPTKPNRGNREALVAGYIAEEALDEGNGRLYNEALNQVAGRALIATYEEAVRNTFEVNDALRLVVCPAYEAYKGKLSPAQMESVNRMRGAHKKLSEQFTGSVFRDGVYGLDAQALLAYQVARELEIEKLPGQFSLFGGGAAREWIKSLNKLSLAQENLAVAAFQMRRVWNIVAMYEDPEENLIAINDFETKPLHGTSTFIREKMKLAYLLRKWAVANGEINHLINRMLMINGDLWGDAFADGGRGEACKRIMKFRSIDWDFRNQIPSTKEAESYVKFNSLVLNGGQDLMDRMDDILAGETIPFVEIKKDYADRKPVNFTVRRFRETKDTSKITAMPLSNEAGFAGTKEDPSFTRKKLGILKDKKTPGGI